ncbi:MAG: IS200/IS605 family accessory protein TnpB-related protein [Cyanobacteria bacterium P01_D01_bin.50]
MAKKKSQFDRNTTLVRNKSKDPNADPMHRRVGIEAKIGSKDSVHPFVFHWADNYQSLYRRGVKDLNAGQSKSNLSKSYQKEFDVQWAWVDSLLTDAGGTIEQLKSSLENQIDDLVVDIASGKEKAQRLIEQVEKELAEPTKKGHKRVPKLLMGIRSKLLKNTAQQEKLDKLKQIEAPKVCFGGSKLFKAQYNKQANGYSSHEEWLEDWRKARSGSFYSVGKGSASGNNPVAKIYHEEEDNFCLLIQVPRYLQSRYGEWVRVDFQVDGQRKHDLLYALESNKAVTVQVFRRTKKNNQWYIHLTTYVQETPMLHTKKNGVLGIDQNANSIDVTYVKPDGNLGTHNGQRVIFSFPVLDTWTTGQRKAALRDIAAQIVTIAELLGCAVALENLDFAKKKAALRNGGSKRYNKMLCGLVYEGFRTALHSRCDKRGVQIIYISPINSSIEGMTVFMKKYGLNSASSAALIIGRRALGHKTIRLPKSFSNSLAVPVDSGRASRKVWVKYWEALKAFHIRRHLHFDSTTIQEVLARFVADQNANRKKGRKKKQRKA